MNKIKIVNQGITQLMQTTAKQFQVLENPKTNNSNSKRPKTPHQIFKSVIKQAIEAELHFKNTQRLKTTTPNYTKRNQKFQQRCQPHLSVVQKKNYNKSQKRYRPSTVEVSRRTNKMKTQKPHEKQDINELKNEIAEVFSQFQAQNNLQKIRLKNRYIQYGQRKFGRYWNIHNINLSKKNLANHKKITNFNTDKSTFINILSK